MIHSFCPASIINTTWAASGARLPTPLRICTDTYRVYFAARCPENFSRIGYLDIYFNENNAFVQSYSTSPSLDLGDVGMFDEHGSLPSAVLQLDDRLLMFYTGWRRCVQESFFQASIGIAESYDNGITFNRLFKGPILGQNIYDPTLAASPTIFIKDERIFLVYCSGKNWIYHSQGPWPRYLLQAREVLCLNTFRLSDPIDLVSLDAEHFNQTRGQIISHNAGYSLILCATNGSHMPYHLYSSFSANRFPLFTDRPQLITAYDQLDGACQMQCYPAVIEADGCSMLFFNGNQYGKDSFFVDDQFHIV